MFLDQKEFEKFVRYCYFNDIPPSEFKEGYLGFIPTRELHQFANNSSIGFCLAQWREQQPARQFSEFTPKQRLNSLHYKLSEIDWAEIAITAYAIVMALFSAVFVVGLFVIMIKTIIFGV